MRDLTHHLMQLQGVLSIAREIVERLADDAPPGEDDRAVIAAAMVALETSQPRTRADILRFVDAIQGGDESFLVVRSVAGEPRIEAVYCTTLTASVRKSVGI